MSVPHVKPRQLWLDIARGVGVILVVYGHVVRGLIGADALPSEPWVCWSDFALYSFHMPLFFFLSGLNVFHSLGRGRKAFLAEKLWTVGWPYLLWSLIQGSVAAVFASRTNAGQTFDRLLTIGWEPIAQFWFLYALMILHLAVLLVGRRPRILLALGVVAFVSSAFAPVDSLARSILYSFLFYAAGVAMGPWLRKVTVSRAQAALGLALGVPLFALAVAFCGVVSGLEPQALVTILCAVAGGYVVLCIGWIGRGPLARAAAYVGQASMTIYVLHILAASGTRIAMSELGLSLPYAVNIAAGLLVGTAAPIVVHAVLKRFDLLWPLGLAARRRPGSAAATPVGAAARAKG
jgi:fucose 4-O-acetylase-like acetyltransferase